MKFILAKKQTMTQVWDNEKVVAVTPVKVESCFVTAFKTTEKDGYNAVQVSFGKRKEKNINKPQLVNFKKINIAPKKLKEFRVETLPENVKIGDEISVNTFAKGDNITVTGTSKGRGFQGVVKRHGFSGTKATHGNKDQLRMPGSIGATGPAHVFKGMRMPGRMGCDRITIANLEVVDVKEEENVIYVKGAVPGHVNALLMIKSKEGEIVVKEEKKEEIKEEKEIKTEEKVENTEVKEEKAEIKEEVKKEEKVESSDKKEEKPAEKKEEKKEEIKEEDNKNNKEEEKK
ncbi:50S ribosomal protein L3 [bacterium]|nr:50S ribosomal protein L3 [bacterium]